jgi:serine/threonine protein kinase
MRPSGVQLPLRVGAVPPSECMGYRIGGYVNGTEINSKGGYGFVVFGNPIDTTVTTDDVVLKIMPGKNNGGYYNVPLSDFLKEKKLMMYVRDNIIKGRGVKSLMTIIDGWSFSDKYHVLAVERLRGIELYSYIEKTLAAHKRFGEDDLRRAIDDVFRGLGELHNHNILHLDLKPENLRFRKEHKEKDGTFTYSELVILDFGLAFHLDWDTRVLPTTSIGTDQYKSPEIHPDFGLDSYVEVVVNGHEKKTGKVTSVNDEGNYVVELDGIPDQHVTAARASVRKLMKYSPAVDVFAMGVSLYRMVHNFWHPFEKLNSMKARRPCEPHLCSLHLW